MKFADVLQSLFVGVFLTLVLFSVFLAGIYNNYIHYYGIKEYFNPFFSNVVSPYIFFIFAISIGIGFILPIISIVFKVFYLLSLVFSLMLFIPSFGHYMGSKLLSKMTTITINNESKTIDSIYENKFYIIYLSSEVLDTDSLEDRARKLLYYEKPSQ